MRIRTQGQSMVEIALLAPLLFTILFILIDAGFWIYGYGSIYNAARRASEAATKMPPHPSQLDPMDMSDPCVSEIVETAADQAFFFLGTENDIRNGRITILYPSRSVVPGGTVLPQNDPGLRLPKGQIQVTVRGEAEFLTPIARLLGLGPTFRIEATSRRTIENTGINPGELDGLSCTDD